MTATPGGEAATTHPCMRCGRPVADPDDGLCEECNPLGLAQPSATQVHGIAVAGIIAFVVVLAVAAKFAVGGVGPFRGEVLSVAPAEGGLTVEMVVANDGSKDAATTCSLVIGGASAGSSTAVVQTPVVPAGGEVEFTASVTAFGTTPVGLLAECASP